jgi:hypothetical protein
MGTPAYDRENTRRINLKLNNKTDADIIAQLEKLKSSEGIQGYLKRLIREDMTKQAKPIPSTKQAEANFNATLELMKAITKRD